MALLVVVAPAGAAPAWHQQNPNTITPTLTDVSFVDASHGWAVGLNGRILTTTNGGDSWAPQTSGTVENLFGISFVDSNHGWAVGSEGTILSTADGGANWAPQTPGVSNGLNAVFFLDADNGWAVGDSGTILATADGGATWVPQVSGTSQHLLSLSFVDADHGWAVGAFGATVATTDGGVTWSPQSNGSAVLNDVEALNATHAWAVGTGGAISATADGGTTWVPQSSGVSVQLNSLSFVDASNGWAVGDDGTILTTVDGGANWVPQASGVSEDLRGVSFSSPGQGAAVGEGPTALGYYDATLVSRFDVNAPSIATAGGPFDFVVTARDAVGRVATEFPGTVEFASSDAQAILPGDSTLTNGTGNFSATLRTGGVQTISAESGAVSGASGTIAVSPGPPASFEVSVPGSATAGDPFDFTVRARDQFGNVATGFSGPVEFTSSDPQATLPAGATLTGGTGTFSATLRTAGAQTISASISNGTVTGTSAQITVSPGPAASFTLEAPLTRTAGLPFVTNIFVRDQFGNINTDFSGTVHYTSTDPQATLPPDSPVTGGGASFTTVLRTAGNQTISASSGALSGTSNPVAVTAAAATQLEVSAPTAATAGSPFDFDVTALDPFGNVDTGFSGTVEFTSTDPQATLPADSPLTDGTGTFSATLRTAGNQTLSAHSGSLSGTSGPIGVAKATPALTASASAGIALGGDVHATATLSGGESPTGLMVVNLFGPHDETCSGTPAFTDTIPVSGNGPYESAEFAPTQAGTYRWVAEYPGDANNLAVSSACDAAEAVVTVAKGHTTTALAAAPNPSQLGSPITLTATVTGFAPTGTVTFKRGSTELGTATVSATGEATFTTSSLSVGSHALSAHYEGDANNEPSASAELSAVVEEPPPPPPPPPPPSTPPPAPRVTIVHSPNKPHAPNRAGGPRWSFRFADQAPGVTFHCRLDRRPFRVCTSPTVYRNLKRGRHVFQVKSVDAAGQSSPVQTVRFTVGKRRR